MSNGLEKGGDTISKENQLEAKFISKIFTENPNKKER